MLDHRSINAGHLGRAWTSFLTRSGKGSLNVSERADERRDRATIPTTATFPMVRGPPGDSTSLSSKSPSVAPPHFRRW